MRSTCGCGRPGRAGPLATHIEAFEHYQLNEAWTWEHMAMSRGRAIAGDAGLMARVSGVLDAHRRRSRATAAKLAADVASMRGPHRAREGGGRAPST